MGLKIFEIEFDNPTKTFLAGQNLVGKVIVDVDQVEIKIQELVLRLWGKAEVSWVDPKKPKHKSSSRPKSGTPEIRISHSKDEISSDKIYSNEESYFDRRHTILEKKGNEELCIGVGRNAYPFEIVLPSGVPSSFNSEHGWVKYELEATIKRPSGQYDYNCQSRLEIQGVLDLNIDHQAQIDKPSISHEEQLGCLCCKSGGPIGFNFGILGNAGVIPGDKMQFLADIYNMSDSREVFINLKLVQITTYHVEHACKMERKELLKLQGPSVRRGGTGTWTDSIKIPEAIPPTRLASGKCNLISVEYSLQVTVETPRGKQINAQLSIVVGTIPFGSKLEDLIASLNLNPLTTNF